MNILLLLNFSLSRYQFPPLSNLKSIDVSNCRIRRIDNTAFKNLGESVESIMLNNNQLTTLAPDVLVPLLSLKKVPLHSNPWKCDCKLKHFRDWLIAKKVSQNRVWFDIEPIMIFFLYYAYMK